MLFAPRKLAEILPDSKMVFLTARGDPKRKNEYILNNTKLHEAVLANDSEAVAKLLADNKESKNIDKVSLMNPPLLLALKQGNVKIAKLILAKAQESEDLGIDINHKDARGLTALDWACMLRDDEIIKMILSSPDLTIPKDSYAKALYNQPVDEKIFTGFLQEIAKNGIEKEIPEQGGYPRLYIFLQEPYSDMIYFMRDICVNREVMEAKDFPILEGTSHQWFYRCFELGYKPFCEARNKIPIDKELLTAMLSQEALVEWRKKAASSLDPKEKEKGSLNPGGGVG